jgi:hypothetical protein
MNTLRATTAPEGSDTLSIYPEILSAENNSGTQQFHASAGGSGCQGGLSQPARPRESSVSGIPPEATRCPKTTKGAIVFHPKSSAHLGLKVLLASANNCETGILQEALQELGHRVLVCARFDEAAKRLNDWQPDLLLTEECIARGDRNCGLRLVELCGMATEQAQGTFCTQALILVPVADWDRMKRAQGTGAHVIVKSPSFDAVVRYVQTIADRLTTDRVLGPILFGIHRFRGVALQRFCSSCEWVGASLSYGTSQTDVPLTSVRATILNSLLFCRRGLSPGEIAGMIDQHRFLKFLLKGKTLRPSAIKMEITRLRRDIEEALRRIGAPYGGNHFLPLVQHGFERYRLAGNWHLSHAPIDA